MIAIKSTVKICFYCFQKFQIFSDSYAKNKKSVTIHQLFASDRFLKNDDDDDDVD